MADSQHGFLNKVRSQVSDSPEFRALAASLYSGVRDSLRSEDVPSFGALTREEQEALVNQVRVKLLDDEVYARCRDATFCTDESLDFRSLCSRCSSSILSSALESAVLSVSFSVATSS